MSILALPALYSPECVEGEFCELRPNGVLRSSPKIFPDLAHLDERGRHISAYTGRRRSAGERLGKGGVKDDPALAEEVRESFYRGKCS